MDFLTSPTTFQLAAIAAGGWLFALACFIGFNRPRKNNMRAARLRVLSRPANIVDIDELRARHARIYKPRRAA